MNLLLTSGGLTNEKLVASFKELVGKPLEETKVAFIATAALGEPGDKRWFVDDLVNLYKTGVNEVDILDIAGQDQAGWQPRLEAADVIWVEGGDTKYLMHHIARSGLQKMLPELLKKRVYVGVSAGSMVMGVCAPASTEETMIYPEDSPNAAFAHVQTYMEYVNAIIMPHYNGQYFSVTPEKLGHIASLTKTPIYALDDGSALLVKGNIVQVVSTGDWKAYNA